MVTRLLQSSVGSGKTEATLKHLSAIVNDPNKSFARVWVLLASGRQQANFRERLTQLPDERNVYFNTEVFDFAKLNDRLLKMVNLPQPHINDATRLSFLRVILQQLDASNRLQVFDTIAEKVGFAQLIARLIDELKQNLIEPETLATYAMTAKDKDIALIYQHYQAMLIDNHLVDSEGEAWLALNALYEHPRLAHDVDLVIVDGFDQFSVVQAKILAELSAHVGEMLITLTSMGEDTEKQQLGGRFQQALHRLEEAHREIDGELICEKITAVSNRHDDLQTLNQTLFDLNKIQQTPSAYDRIRFFEAPEPASEVAMILRDIKQRLLAGIKPDQILIALRDWQLYQSHLLVLGRLYDLPLLMHYEDPIANNPAINILMKALALSAGVHDPAQAHKGFSRRHVLDVLRSPYVRVDGLDEETIQFLDDMSQAYQIIRGYDAWFDAIDNLLHAQSDYSYDDDGEKFVPNINATPEFLNSLSVSLEAFFTMLTPPENASLTTYIAHIERIIGVDMADADEPDESDPFDYPVEQNMSLNMPECIRETSNDPTLRHLTIRDVTALNAFKDILRGYLANQEVLRYVWGLDSSDALHWDYLLNDLRESVATNQISLGSMPRSGRILVTTATNARGLPHDYVYIAGMSEGVFPALRKEDPIYLDSERLAMREASDNAVWLPTQAEQTDDAGLFYELISLAHHTLTLSRSTVQSGKPWNESYLWRLARETFADHALETIRLGIGELPKVKDIASIDEAFLVVANGLPPKGKVFDPDVAQLLGWLLAQSGMKQQWQFIMQAALTEEGRLSAKPYNAYSGVIQQSDLKASIASELDDWYLWSASRLNDVGACAYKFFASRLLKLESISEPEEGFDNLQYGSLIHQILERIYNQIADEAVAIHRDNLATASEIAEEILNEVIEHAPIQFGVRTSPQWRYEQSAIRRLIIQAVTFDFLADVPIKHPDRQIFANELRFNIPILVKGWEHPLRLRGSIDRVDRIDNTLYVIDYKTGSAPDKKSLADGRNFQMFVYLRALEAYLASDVHEDLRVGGGYFWSLRDTKKPQLWKNNASTGEPFMDEDGYFSQAEEKLVAYLGNIQRGDFSVAPASISQNGRCISYCEFYQLCRLTNMNRYKKEPNRPSGE